MLTRSTPVEDSEAGDGTARGRVPPRSRLIPTSRDRPAGPRGGRHADTATLYGGGQAAHPKIGRCLYRGGQSGGAASHRGTLCLEPHHVAPPTHGWCALGLDAPEARPKGISPASAAGGA